MTNVRIYAGSNILFSRLRQIPEPFEDFDNNYFIAGFNVGLRVPLMAELSSYEGQLENEFIFNYAGGNEKNLGSHRFQFGWMTGWKQNFLNAAYLRTIVGIGVNENWLNFGRGVPLEKEVNASFVTQVELGVDICSKQRALCLSPSFGFRYEIALNNPHYDIWGWMGSLTVSGSFTTVDQGVYDRDIGLIKAEKDQLSEELRKMESAKKYAESQLLFIARLNEKLIEKNETLVNPKRKQVADFMNNVILFSPAADKNAAADILNTENGGQTIQKQLDALVAQIRKKSIRLRLHGHTVPSGDALHDQLTSYKYALAVKNYMLSQGLSPDKIILDAQLLGPEANEVTRLKEARGAMGPSVHGSDDVNNPADKKCAKKRCVSFEIIFTSKKP